MTDISQVGGWLAILYLLVKDVVVPVLRKTIPAKVKSEIKQETKQIEHAHEVELKRLDAELSFQKQIADAVVSINSYISVSNDRMAQVEADVKEVKADVHDVKADVHDVKAAVIKSRKRV